MILALTAASLRAVRRQGVDSRTLAWILAPRVPAIWGSQGARALHAGSPLATPGSIFASWGLGSGTGGSGAMSKEPNAPQSNASMDTANAQHPMMHLTESEIAYLERLGVQRTELDRKANLAKEDEWSIRDWQATEEFNSTYDDPLYQH